MGNNTLISENYHITDWDGFYNRVSEWHASIVFTRSHEPVVMLCPQELQQDPLGSQHGALSGHWGMQIMIRSLIKTTIALISFVPSPSAWSVDCTISVHLFQHF